MMTAHAKKISVLVVEDNPVNQEVMLSMLEDYGIDARLAQNGQEAITAVHDFSFDLILMDCQMPVLDGIAATTLIRKTDEVDRNIPIIAMTANTMMQDRDECLAAGMNDFLTKPVRKRDLEWILSKWASCIFGAGDMNRFARGASPSPLEGRQLDAPHLDTDVLVKLQAALKDRFPLMLETFLGSSERSLSHIAEAIETADMMTVARSAHSMKAAGQIGAMPLYHLAGLVERAAKTNDSSALPDLLTQLKAEFQLVQSEIIPLLQ